MTTASPAAPKAPEKHASTAASASSRVAATVTPLPAASPSALTTIGAPLARTWSRGGPARAEGADARGREVVHDAGRERPLGPDHDEVHARVAAEARDRGVVRQ